MFRSFPLSMINPMFVRLRLIYVSPTSAVRHSQRHTFVSHDLLFSPSVSPPTMASADFSQFVVTTANEPPARPHGISPEPFPVYSPDLRIKVTVAFWDFDASCHLIRLIRLTIRFLSVEPRFRYCFFSPTPHDVNLASRYRVRWQLRPLGLPPKVRDMPVIQKDRHTLAGYGGLRP